MTRSSDPTITDLFCGAGGSTIGAKSVPGVRVRTAANHWKRAIETHNLNNPEVDHLLVDIHEDDPRHFATTTILIASPECTNHSLSKGEKRKDIGKADLWGFNKVDEGQERSRCSMWDPLRFTEHHRYEIVILENVVDVRLWEHINEWYQAWRNLGYDFEIVYLNSMFFHPTPQSRDRWYFVAWKHGNPRPNLSFTPPAYCANCAQDVAAVQAWKKSGNHWGRYGKTGQYFYCCPKCAKPVTPYYYAAWNAIDWSIVGQRIGDRKKPLEANTMRRIRLGLEKFVNPYVLQVNKTTDRVRDVHEPMPTMTATPGLAVVTPKPYLFARPLPEPAAPATPFMVELHGTSTARSITKPMGAICAQAEHHAVVTPPGFLLQHGHGSGDDCRIRSFTEPTHTMTVVGSQYSIVEPPQGFISRYFTTTDPNVALTEPMPVITANYEHNALIQPPEPFIVSYYGTSEQPKPLTAPVPTQVGQEMHGLAQPGVDIEDCRFRMLEPHEIQRAMGFPDAYTVTGTRREQVKQLGNAVTPSVMTWLVERCVATLAS